MTSAKKLQYQEQGDPFAPGKHTNIYLPRIGPAVQPPPEVGLHQRSIVLAILCKRQSFHTKQTHQPFARRSFPLAPSSIHPTSNPLQKKRTFPPTRHAAWYIDYKFLLKLVHYWITRQSFWASYTTPVLCCRPSMRCHHQTLLSCAIIPRLNLLIKTVASHGTPPRRRAACCLCSYCNLHHPEQLPPEVGPKFGSPVDPFAQAIHRTCNPSHHITDLLAAFSASYLQSSSSIDIRRVVVSKSI